MVGRIWVQVRACGSIAFHMGIYGYRGVLAAASARLGGVLGGSVAKIQGQSLERLGWGIQFP